MRRMFVEIVVFKIKLSLKNQKLRYSQKSKVWSTIEILIKKLKHPKNTILLRKTLLAYGKVFKTLI